MTRRNREWMRLLEGQYFGSAVRQVVINGLTLTLSRYSDKEAQPWHTHENPTLFFLSHGGLRDRRRREEIVIGTQICGHVSIVQDSPLPIAYNRPAA
jgi:hypothetical protein